MFCKQGVWFRQIISSALPARVSDEKNRMSHEDLLALIDTVNSKYKYSTELK